MEPLTRPQRAVFVAVTLAAAVTRWLALSKTPWDWDEMLFTMAMRRYDVALHHPHPPGFPLWIFFADLVHALGPSEFHALQFLAFLGAVAVVPAMFFLCRALRMPFSTSLAAATILAFFPNVWFFGGTALSDVPSMTLVVIALALLFPLPASGERVAEGRVRGATRRYFAGVALLAVAGGIRPQNLLIGAVPLLLASLRRRPRDVAAAALIGAAIVGASYGVAIEKTGWSAYREAVALHSEYIAKTDSFRSALRPPLSRVFVDFFVRPYRMPAINIAVTLFAAISLVVSIVKRRRHVLLMLAAFGPFCIFAWLMLDHFSASRFSIGYAPLIALLAADGIALLGHGAQGAGRRWWPRDGVVSTANVASREATICAPPPAPCALELTLAAILILGMSIWTWPALRVVHTTISPPVQAIDWIRAHVDRHTPLYVHLGMLPYAEALLPERDVRGVLAPPAPWTSGPTPLFLREDAGAIDFIRPRGHLWWLTRQRYFVVSVSPVAQRAVMRSGWYDEEGDDRARWRWMGARGVVELPPQRRAHLLLSFYVPLDVLGAAPDVDVRLNGAAVAHVHATKPDNELELDVDARAGAPNELVIETSRTVHPPNDPRVLGLRLNDLQWSATE